MKLGALLCVLVVCGIPFATSKRYNGYKLYRVTFEAGRTAEVITLVDQIDGAEIWMLSMAKGTADVFVAPNVEGHLLTELRRKGLTFTVLNDDVQGVIDGVALG